MGGEALRINKFDCEFKELSLFHLLFYISESSYPFCLKA